MVRIPTPATQGAAPLGDITATPVQTPFQNIQPADTSFMGRQLQQLGAAAGDLAVEFQRRTDERILLELQNEWQTFENDVFNPKTGVFARRSGDAIGATEEISKRVEDFKSGWQNREGLSSTGRLAAEKFILGAGGTMVGRTRSHETSEDHRYAVEMIDAQIGHQAARVAMADPSDPQWSDDAFDASVTKVSQLTASLADRMGWDGAKFDQELDRRTSQLVTARVIALTDIHDDPVEAFEFLKAHRDNVSGETWTKLYPTLKEAAETRQVNTSVMELVFGDERAAPTTTREAANLLVEQAFSMTPPPGSAGAAAPVIPGSWSNVDFNMGPARPHSPNAPILHVMSSATAAVLGDGGRVEVFSGQEGDLPQHGSERHKTGAAADVRFYRGDGSLVKISDPEFLELAYSMALQGALGIGFGIEYMGNAMHVDIIDPSAQKGEGHIWGSGAKANAIPLMEAMASGDARVARELLGLPEGVQTGEVNVKSAIPKGIASLYTQYGDRPELFFKALQTYNALQSEVRTQINREKEDIIDGLYSQISTARSEGIHVELDEIMTQEQRVRLGNDISSVEAYYNNTMGTDLIQTTAYGWDVVDRIVGLAGSADPQAADELLAVNFAKDVRPYVDDATWGVVSGIRESAVAARAARGIPYTPAIPNYGQIQTVVKNVAKAMPSYNEMKDDAARDETLLRLTDQALRMATDFSAGEQTEVDQNLLHTLMRRQMIKTTLDLPGSGLFGGGGQDDIMLPMAILTADETYTSWEDLADEGFGWVTSQGEEVSIDSDVLRGIASSWETRHGVEPLPSELLTQTFNLYLLQNPSAAYGIRVFDRAGFPEVSEEEAAPADVPFTMPLTETEPDAMMNEIRDYLRLIEEEGAQ